MAVRYEDFTIRLSATTTSGTLNTTVEKSPLPNNPIFEGTLTLPGLEAEASLAGRADAPGTVRGTVGGLKMAAPLAAPVSPTRAEDEGRLLYEALFNGAILRALESSTAVVASRSEPGGDQVRLRIRLRGDLSRDGVRRAMEYPWERMRAPEFSVYDVALVRELPVPKGRPYDESTFSDVRRVLLVSATPEDQSRLDAIEDEKKAIEQACLAHGIEKPVVCERASAPDLLGHLNATPFDVVHFMGHGDVDGEGGRLEFQERSASGTTLAVLLGRATSVRLVVLNACRSAAMPDGARANPFAGVATALVKAGVPCVIGMQTRVYDDAARAFAVALYEALFKGLGIEEAVTAGRQAMVAAEFPDDALAPVVFLSSAATVARTPAPSPAPTPAPAPVPMAVPVPSWRRVNGWQMAAGAATLVALLTVAYFLRPGPGPDPNPPSPVVADGAQQVASQESAGQVPQPPPMPEPTTVAISGYVVLSDRPDPTGQKRPCWSRPDPPDKDYQPLVGLKVAVERDPGVSATTDAYGGFKYTASPVEAASRVLTIRETNYRSAYLRACELPFQLGLEPSLDLGTIFMTEDASVAVPDGGTPGGTGATSR